MKVCTPVSNQEKRSSLVCVRADPAGVGWEERMSAEAKGYHISVLERILGC